MIRAYNFDATLVATLKKYYDYIFVNNYVVDKQLLNMRYFFSLCFTKLRLKLKLDGKLH